MMALNPPDTEQLLERAGRGDPTARQQLLTRHRDRLRRMVALRLDRRLAARVDPSDIVQESLAEAHQHLSEYLRDRPLPFYAWLRQFAWERVAKQYERHVRAQRRSVTREEAPPLPDESVAATGPSADRQRHQPEPPPAPRGAARPGPGRPGLPEAVTIARCWSCDTWRG